MPVVPINWISLFLATFAGMIIGTLWYSPLLFGKPWMKLLGFTEKDLKPNMTKIIWFSILGNLLMAFVLTHMSYYASLFYNQRGISVTLTTAFWLWLGIVMPIQLNGWLYIYDSSCYGFSDRCFLKTGY